MILVNKVILHRFQGLQMHPQPHWLSWQVAAQFNKRNRRAFILITVADHKRLKKTNLTKLKTRAEMPTRSTSCYLCQHKCSWSKGWITVSKCLYYATDSIFCGSGWIINVIQYKIVDKIHRKFSLNSSLVPPKISVFQLLSFIFLWIFLFLLLTCSIIFRFLLQLVNGNYPFFSSGSRTV